MSFLQGTFRKKNVFFSKLVDKFFDTVRILTGIFFQNLEISFHLFNSIVSISILYLLLYSQGVFKKSGRISGEKTIILFLLITQNINN